MADRLKVSRLTVKRGAMAAVAAVVVAALAYVAFRPSVVDVDLGAVRIDQMQVTVPGEGVTRIRNLYIVSAPIGGRLLRLEQEVGDEVVGGETVLAAILPNQPEMLDARSRRQAEAAVESAAAALDLAQAEVARTAAELRYARSDFQRVSRLHDRGYAADAQLDAARTRVQVAEAALASAESGVRVAERDLEAARSQLIEPDGNGAAATGESDNPQTCCVELRAPVSGQVLRLFEESQTVVAAGTPLIEIGDVADLEIVADLLSEDAVKVVPGARVEIAQWGGDSTLEGRVRRVEPFGFEEISALGIEEQRVNVIVDITSPREQWTALGHGYSVDVAIEIWARTEARVVPLGALFRDGGRWAVFARDDGRAKLVHVEIGHTNAVYAEVLDGIPVGAQVVLHPSDRISDGTRIRKR